MSRLATLRISTLRRAFLIVVALVALPAKAVLAQQAALRRILDSTVRASGLPAIAAAIVTRDSVLAYDAVGIRKRGNRTPVKRDDIFHIGSDFKAITAGLVGLLVDEQRVKWTATVPELFPELAPRIRPEYQRVTLRDILTHRSGFVGNTASTFGQRTARGQRARFVEWLLAQPPATPPGTAAYANSNYVFAGALVERLTGETYEDQVVRRLLAPLGITTVTFARKRSGTIDQPWGHRPRFWVISATSPESDNSLMYGPAGRGSLSIYDWALWARAVLRSLSGGPSPWKPETAAMLAMPTGPDSTAMGWGVVFRKWAGTSGRMLSHKGSNNRHYAGAYLAPEAGVGILIAINQGGPAAEETETKLASRVLRLWLNGR